MKTTRELLEKNGWEKCGYDPHFDKTYYGKDTYYGGVYIVALNGSMNDVKIDTNYFDSEVEPDFLRKVLEEVEKIEVK